MKSKFAFIALALFAGQASAEWELLSDMGDFKVFIDRSTIRKQNRYTLAWTLSDYAKPDKTNEGKTYSSDKSLLVMKCGEFAGAYKTTNAYKGNFGEGDFVASEDLEFDQLRFKDVIPGTISETMYNAICGIE